jgi:hypothetical protein
VKTFIAAALFALSTFAANSTKTPTIAPVLLRNARMEYPANYNVRVQYGNGIVSKWTPSRSVVITRVQVSAKTVFLNYDSVTGTYSPCSSPTPQLLLSNGTVSFAYNLPNLASTTTRPTAKELTGSSDSGVVRIPFPPGRPISLKFSYDGLTCSSPGSELNINVQYTAVMQQEEQNP